MSESFLRSVRSTAILLAISVSLLFPLANSDMDMQSLLAFKRGITHDPFNALRNWHENSPNACNWTGVTCSSKHTHKVIRLQLTNRNLQGMIAPEIGNLSFLQYINISVNNFSGGIPSSIGGLHRLEVLDIYENNELGGVIPSEMGRLYNLKEFYAYKNGFTGTIPSSLGNCSNLQEFRLSQNKLKGTLPSTFASLKQLVFLDLRENSLVGNIPLSLFNCSKLEALQLGSNRLSGLIPKHVGLLPFLETLDISNNSLTGRIPDSIGNNTALTEIYLVLNHINGSLPSSLSKLSKLMYLQVYNNSLTGTIPSALCNLTSLSWLELQSNQFHNSAPLCLGKLPNLEYFNVADNNLISGFDSPDNPVPIMEAFSNSSILTDFILYNNNFEGTLPLQLPKNLVTLAMDNNRITGSIPKSMGNLSSLRSLSLRGNSFEGTIPAEFGLLNSLQGLDMSDNQFQGSIPREFTLLNQSLAYLFLSGNKLSGSIPAFMGELTSLRMLDLSINSFSDSIPKQLGNCLNLESLDLSSNKLSNEVPLTVFNLKNIQTAFNLSRNNLSGTVAGIGLPMAEIIDLSHNHLSGEITMYMSQWLNAMVIDLSFNTFSGTLPESIGKKLPALESIDLSSNNFTGTIPGSLYNLSALRYLNFSYNNFEGSVSCSTAFRRLSSRAFLHNPLLCGECFNLAKCIGKRGQKHSSTIRNKLVIIVVLVTIVGILLLALLLFLLLGQKRNRSDSEIAPMLEDNHLMIVSEEEVRRATNNFSETNLLGQGSQGSVYVGVLKKDHPVAIKIFSSASHHETEKSSFLKECQTLGKVRHRNLIKITTVCCSENITAIIMPLMPKGNLSSLLHEKDDDGHMSPLGLQSRLRMLKELANALGYLHHYCTPPIVHCDIKPENVLLDYDFTVKLSDFGIAKILENSEITITSTLRGSTGYVAPEVGAVGEVSIQGDIYSFGIVLLEMMTRRRPTDPIFTGDMNMCSWITMALEANESKSSLKDILDFSELEIIKEEELRIVERLLKLGVACCSNIVKERPTMNKVEGMLSELLIMTIGLDETGYMHC